MAEKTKGLDYNALAEGVEDFRETMRAIVAGLVSDGFTDEQARAIVAGFWASRIKTGEDDD